MRPVEAAARSGVTRRMVMLGATAAATASVAPERAFAQAADSDKSFPKGFLWGAATAGYQIEGNSVNSDIWVLEHANPTLFPEKSGDAANSFELWDKDLDLVREIGLNSFRFSLEWARIEPEQGEFSRAMLNHYRHVIAGCRERGIQPIVTFNHFATPRWFAAQGGWTNKQSPDLFTRYCERVARALSTDMARATTLNEPDIAAVLRWQGLPPEAVKKRAAMAAAAARSVGAAQFVAATGISDEQDRVQQPLMIAAHKAGRAAIKSIRPDLPVGVSLSMSDDQAVGPNSRRDEKRADVYGAWLDAARGDDFLGVQNYDRSRVDAKGEMAPPEGAKLNAMGTEIYPASLGASVRYAHQASGVPILVTENGLGTDDDTLRADYIPRAVAGLKAVMDEGVPVLGYIHWSLIDNFEFTSGFKARFGLASVDRQTFVRTLKPSAQVLGAMARRNAL